MKKQLSFLLSFMLIVGTVFSQNFNVDTLQYEGAAQNRVNFVFLGDGYQTNELGTYIDDVQGIVDDLFLESPFSSYKNYFNVIAVKVTSTQSGASHAGTASDEPRFNPPPIASVNNYFGSRFDVAGIHRLLVPSNFSRISTVLARHFPMYDQAFIVVNSPYYGGSGGAYATSSTNVAASEISIHEIGHSFARLADEYWFSGSGESPNKTRQSNPNLVKWKNWLNTGTGVGVFQHSGAGSGWYKPHPSCKMQFLGRDFCAVCKETFVERIHALVDPVDDHHPYGQQVNFSGSTQTFSLNLIKPNPNTLKTVWKLNSVIIGQGVDSVTINQSILNAGINTLSVSVEDTTVLSKSSAHTTVHISTVDWTINNAIVSLESISSTGRMKVQYFPNPTSDILNVKYELDKTSNVRLMMVDIKGKVLSQEYLGLKGEGKYNHQLDMRSYSNGNYILKMMINEVELIRKIIKHE